MPGVENWRIVDKLGLTDDERQLISSSNTGETEYRQITTLTAFYITKHLEEMTEGIIQSNVDLQTVIANKTNEIIKSNKDLADANEKHASSLKWATWALVAATVVLAIITLFSSG